MESTSLRSNFVQRINALPAPRNAAQALTPLFEAISNSIHATQEKFKEAVAQLGRVVVTIETDRQKKNVKATVQDNGIGLDPKNWDAFLTTDTDNKLKIGGKGVGRLMWLDCFTTIRIRSEYESTEGLQRRAFEFCLAPNEQVQHLTVGPAEEAVSGFLVELIGVRPKYKESFPGRGNYIFQHLMSHFLPTFIGGTCPQIRVIIGTEQKIYPEAINEVVRRRGADLVFETTSYGTLVLTMLECSKLSSADLKGSNFVHFIAHDRTVHSHLIDGWLGLKTFGAKDDSVFHGIVRGEFLDDNVNRERTEFDFEDAVFEDIIKEVCGETIRAFLAVPLALLDDQQIQVIKDIAGTYPSVAFGNERELQEKVPSGELKADAIYGHLARERFRRDQKQTDIIRAVLTRLKSGDFDPATFGKTLKEATAAIGETEQRSLADYVVRRRVVLDFMELLLEKVTDKATDAAFQREDILHSFICPVKVSTIKGVTKKVSPASHELWLIDERLTFAQYFHSDVDFAALADAGSTERPDLLVFDYVHGLRQTEQPSRVLLVEFKKPSRTDYDPDDNPIEQVQRYIRRLQSGALKDVNGRPVKLDERTIFYCYIVADIIGKMETWTFGWRETPEGRGKIYRPESGWIGSIEVIGWDALIKDARARNAAFFSHVRLPMRSFFTQSEDEAPIEEGLSTSLA